MERKNALYLDADIICTGNLKDLFNVKFSCVIGIVEDRLGAISQKRKLSELGIPSNERCFNSGVMLIDIDRYVEDDVLSKFIDCIKNNDCLTMYDQDAFNIVLGKEAQYLDKCYNVQAFMPV